MKNTREDLIPGVNRKFGRIHWDKKGDKDAEGFPYSEKSLADTRREQRIKALPMNALKKASMTRELENELEKGTFPPTSNAFVVSKNGRRKKYEITFISIQCES